MRGFLFGLIVGAGAALGCLYYFGSFEIASMEFGRERGTGDDAIAPSVADDDGRETGTGDDIAPAVEEDETGDSGADMASVFCPKPTDVAAGDHAGWVLSNAHTEEDRASVVSFYKAFLEVNHEDADGDYIQCEYKTSGELGNQYVHLVGAGRSTIGTPIGAWELFYEAEDEISWNCGPAEGLAIADCGWNEF